MDNIMYYLPIGLVVEIKKYKEVYDINEIRIVINRNVMLVSSFKEMIIEYVAENKDIQYILSKVSDNSIYTVQNEINNGYITIVGGHRIGICGEVIILNDEIKNIKNISMLNIRISRQVIGCSHKIIEKLIDKKEGKLLNSLIVSPPGCGKTTLLRDITRIVSNGDKLLEIKGQRVSLIDERNEISCMYKGISQMDTGIRTDIMSNCPKSKGIEMMVRSMAPDIVVTDEIGTCKDIEAIEYAITAGITLLFSMHGKSMEDISSRPNIHSLISGLAFDRIVFLSNRHGVGTVDCIYIKSSQGYIKEGFLCL